MWRVLWVAVLVGCYSPTPPSGSPCLTRDDCPDPLLCDPLTSTCQDAECLATSTCPTDATIDDGELDPDTRPPADAQGEDCWSQWTTVTLAFAEPRPLAFSSNKAEGDPSLSPDNLELYFARKDQVFEIYVSRRATRQDPFTSVERVAGLENQTEDSRAALSPDGLELIFASKRSGGNGGSDIWVARRSTPSSNYDTVSLGYTDLLNTHRDQYDPELSADGRTLFFATVPENQAQRIAYAMRPGGGAPFMPPTLLEVNVPGATAVADPTISPDQRVLVFTAAATGSSDLYFATRAATSDPLVVMGRVPSVNTDGGLERDAELSADGCQLYFARGAGSGQQPGDIYVADVVR